MASTIEKKYVYKVSRAGVELGNLPYVTSEFGYTQSLNTAGAQLKITCGVSADTANLPVEELTDELGNPLTAEDGSTLTTERVADIVGDTNSNNLIRNDNDIEVVEYSQSNPNGVTVFKGYIAKWKVAFGGNDNVEITVVSHGQDLSHYIVEGGDTAHITQTTENGNYLEIGDDTGHGLNKIAIQKFTLATQKVLSAVTVSVQTYEAATLYVYIKRASSSTPAPTTDATLGYGSIALGVQSNTATKVSLNTPVTVSAGSDLYFYVNYTSRSTFAHIYSNNTNPYAGGDLWSAQSTGTYYSILAQYSGSDLYFNIFEYGGATTVTYTSKDTSYMLNDVMQGYIDRGGDIGVPASPVVPDLLQPAHGSNIPSAYWGNNYDQIFTPVEDMVVNVIQLYGGVTSGSGFIFIDIYQGSPETNGMTVMGGVATYDNWSGATYKTSANIIVMTNTATKVLSTTLDTPITLLAGTKYFLHIFYEQGEFSNNVIKTASNGDLPITAAGVGKLYYCNASINNAGYSNGYSTSYPALYFGLGYIEDTTTNLDAGYANTGVTTTYSFKVQTVLEVINSIYSLSPYNWYWYVDPADDTLYFAETSTTADHTMVKGKHIVELEIEATKERITNVVYFSGGPTAGVNTYKKTTDADSLAANRVGLARLSDNRVTTDAVATVISQSYIDQNNAETYLTEITIYDNTYDISLFKLGDTVGFANFGTFVDNLIMQIVGLKRSVDSITLSLGVIPRRESKKVEEIQQKLIAEQTLNNPSTPT